MNLARVIGNIWATVKIEGLEDATMLLIQPVDAHLEPTGKPIAAVDTVGAGRIGELVFYITSYEAVLATGRTLVAIDAAICGIVDELHHQGREREGIASETIRGEDQVRPVASRGTP